MESECVRYNTFGVEVLRCNFHYLGHFKIILNKNINPNTPGI